MFDEPMTAAQLNSCPHQVTRLGSNAQRLVRGEVERVLWPTRIFLCGAQLTCLTSTLTSCVISWHYSHKHDL